MATGNGGGVLFRVVKRRDGQRLLRRALRSDPNSLPERAVPIPGSKPPVFSLPYKDLGSPEEVDAFREVIREIRRQLPAQPK